jgi:dethiobiotin synthetase
MTAMTSKVVPGLFFTGTDTGVGKTYVAALVARSLRGAGHRVGVYKPAASGCRREGDALVCDDAVLLWEAAGRPGPLERVCPQRFQAPLAPHLAAKAEGRRLDPDLLRRGLDYWTERSEIVLVEGAGGLMSPLGDGYIADLAADFGLPLVIVARNALGTINQTLQTLIAAAAFRRGEAPRFGGATGEDRPEDRRVGRSPTGLHVAGIVLNNPSPPSPSDPSTATNRGELAARCRVPLLAEVAWGANCFDSEVDWFRLAGRRK